MADRWSSFSPLGRRRIVLGALFGVSLAARDLLLLATAAGFFALSELAPASRAPMRAAS